MAFLDKTGVTTLVTKLKDYFQRTLISGTNIKTINGESLLAGGDIQLAESRGDVINSTSKTYSFTAKSAGAHGYFQITWVTSSRPFAVNVHTTSISALNGTQFSVVNITNNGCYITYYCPVATTSTISLIIYAYYKS